jgi:hypothetical protein
MRMSETASSPTWDEYLAEATAHLSAVRAAAESGTAPPTPPELPDGPIPDHRRDEALRLASGYDQLAAEVATHMALIEQLRPASMRRGPHQEHQPAHFIDTPA